MNPAEPIRMYSRQTITEAIIKRHRTDLKPDLLKACRSCGKKWQWAYTDYYNGEKQDWFVCKRKSCHTLLRFLFVERTIYRVAYVRGKRQWQDLKAGNI
jgi:hypothetical protein